jgi:WS/DGAT/MGAT family acyltransferase
MLRRGVTGIARTATDIAAAAVRGVTQPQETVGDVANRALGVAELLRAYAFSAPQTALNRKPGPHRNYAVVTEQLSHFKEIRRTLGGTLNDVVLTVVAGGLRRFLADHGAFVDELAVRCLVPMSIRTKEGRGAAGNQIVVLVARLYVDVEDPVERLAHTHAEMERLKAGRQAVGARTMTQMENFAPPNVLAQAARLGFSSRLYNLLITNVPGPQFPVYMLGRQMLAAYPVAFLAPEHTLAVAVLSYNGQITISLIGDADALPDIDKLAGHVSDSLPELLAAARASMPGSP